jgi:hypothetical protein
VDVMRGVQVVGHFLIAIFVTVAVLWYLFFLGDLM